ncbi:MAG: SoxR reducing system RseC family protein [Clostridiaceae bacterium]|jgi:sigma-E factor negative regulatory protein RseC|nr:SoxR reducing system RseC family protein [Clostridiaceae bacterium]
MKEIGKVVKIEEDQATILITRGTACGDCGKCQVGRDKLEMIMTADNNVGAQVGDEVEIELENMNFMTAVMIAYGFPLLALTAGIFGGYYGSLALGQGNDTAQVFGAVLGLAALAVSYVVIKFKDESIRKMKKFKPVIIGIKAKDTI